MHVELRAALDHAEKDESVRALARQLAAGPTRAYAMTKRVIHASGGHDLPKQLEMERDLQRRAVEDVDYFEGVGAFLQKRAPNFQGR